jgi:colicin import membrane protein
MLGLAFVGVALVDLGAGLALFTILTFFEAVPGVDAAGLTLVRAAGFVLAGAWLLRVARRDSDTPFLFRDRPVLAYAGVAFLGWAAISQLWAPDVGLARTSGLRLVQGFVLALIAYSAISERRDFVRLVWAFMTGAFLTALAGLAGASSAESFDPDLGTSRLSGQIGDPNELAAILVPALWLAAFALGTVRNPLLRWLLAVYALVFLLALFLTESRGGIVALAVSSAAAIVLAGRVRARALVAILSAAAVGGTYYALVAPPESLSRVTQFTAGGGSGRTDIWSVALEVSSDHLVLGTGIGNFVVVEPTYAARDIPLEAVRLVVDTPLVVHNMYLHVLAELGLVGLAGFALIVAAALVTAWQAIRLLERRGDGELELLARGLLVGMIGMLGAYVFLSAQYEKQLWLLIGVALGVHGLARRARPPEAAVEAPTYDRLVSERLAEQLEEREHAFEASTAGGERERELDAREAALAARAAELERVQEELAARASEPGERELAERNRALEVREAQLVTTERELAARAQALDLATQQLLEAQEAVEAQRAELAGALEREQAGLREQHEQAQERAREVAERARALETGRRGAEEREAALAERERTLAAHVHAVDAARAAAEAGTAELEQRLAEQERLLADRLRELERREAALGVRERALAALEQGGDAALTQRAVELEEREARLEERIQLVGRRELELARRAASVAVEQREVERAREQVERETTEPAPEPEPPAEEPASPGPVDDQANVPRLEDLVRRYGDEFQDRLEEWSFYLLYLRDFAEPNGDLPRSLRPLVDDVFGDLLARAYPRG